MLFIFGSEERVCWLIYIYNSSTLVLLRTVWFAWILNLQIQVDSHGNTQPYTLPAWFWLLKSWQNRAAGCLVHKGSQELAIWCGYITSHSFIGQILLYVTEDSALLVLFSHSVS